MEREMYPILKTYFESQNYTVKAEVKNVDFMAIKNDQVVLVEMKTTLNTKLIAQGIQRNTIGDLVYLCIPKPTDRVLKSKLFKDKCLILKHLGLGLLLVDQKYQIVNRFLDPADYTLRQRKKKRSSLIKEFQERKTTTNIGGTNRKKIMTAYRELALLALDFMKDSPRTTKALREYTGRKKVVSILQNNYYGWFERISRGVYGITDVGRQALKTYADVLHTLKTTYFQDDESEQKN